MKSARSFKVRILTEEQVERKEDENDQVNRVPNAARVNVEGDTKVYL